MLELRRMVHFLSYDEETFAELLAQKTSRDIAKEQKSVESELQKSIVRSETVARLYEKLHKDDATGKVTDEWFIQMQTLTAPPLRELINTKNRVSITQFRYEHSICLWATKKILSAFLRMNSNSYVSHDPDKTKQFKRR